LPSTQSISRAASAREAAVCTCLHMALHCTA
jgi:hypothetical protein